MRRSGLAVESILLDLLVAAGATAGGVVVKWFPARRKSAFGKTARP
ncbi:MAG: hypothetical protein IPH91_00005 [Elusimicrobia bacterium]|nr:hypothetical protein [Elusimicrobiota bacterium]